MPVTLAVVADVLPDTTGWPDALVEPPPAECPCATAVRDHLRAFFKTTTTPPA